MNRCGRCLSVLANQLQGVAFFLLFQEASFLLLHPVPVAKGSPWILLPEIKLSWIWNSPEKSRCSAPFLCSWGQQGSEMLGTRLTALSEPEAESRLRSSPLTPVRDSQNLRIGINFKPQVSFPAPGFSPVNQTFNRFILMLPNDDAFFSP